MGQKITPEQFNLLHEHYLKHPDEFITEVLGSQPWGIQTEIIKSVNEYKYTAVKTCNAIGKSYIAARIVVAYLMLHPDSIVVTTAPTWRQVTDVLWREIGTAIKKSKFKLGVGEVNQAGLNLDTNWYAVGLSTKRPENFFGYHADNILVVVDEAGGVEEPIYKGVAAITPNIGSKVLLIGNPTNPSGTFYDAFTKPELGYNCFTISAFQTPNFTDVGIKTTDDLERIFTPKNGHSQAKWTEAVNKELEKRSNPVYRSLINPATVYSRFHEWGVDSPAWQSLIMGEFPTEADNALIPTDLVAKAMQMTGVEESSGLTMAELSGWNIPDGPMEYGQDMARFGSDSSVCYPRHGGWVQKPFVWNKLSLMASADKILGRGEYKVPLIDYLDSSVRLNIDDTGNGGGTTDRLRQISEHDVKAGQPGHRYQLVAYNFGSKERMHNQLKFHDITSELYWNLASWFRKKQIAIPYDKQLFDELVGRRWALTPSGKIKVESKEDYKKRTGGKSPDRSDALALAFAGGLREIPQPRTVDEEIKSKQREHEAMPITAGLDSRY
jgi:phage terminase large subunit